MDKTLIQSIVNDSTILLGKTAELQEQAAKVPGLEKQAADLALDVARLNKEAADQADKIAKEAERLIAPYVEKKVITAEKCAAALEVIRQDPSQVVEVIGKIAAESTAQQIGNGDDGKEAAADVSDPIVAFCRS